MAKDPKIERSDYSWQIVIYPPSILFIGYPEITKELFMGLEVGSKVTHVGDAENRKGMSVLNCLDPFITHVTYVGTVVETPMNQDGSGNKLILFKIPKSQSPSKIEPCYIAYIVLTCEDGSKELKVPDEKNNTVRIYRPKFTLI